MVENIEKEQSENKLFQFARDNYGWLAAAATLICFVVTIVVKFADYLRYYTYNLYYGINIEYYIFNDKSLIWEVGMALILFSALFSLVYCFKHIFQVIKTKETKYLISDIVIIILVNLLAAIILYINNNFTGLNILLAIIINVLILFIIELIASIIILGSIKSLNNNKKIESSEDATKALIHYLKILPFYTIFIIILTLISQYFALYYNKSYSIINTQEGEYKVIVHADEDYYIILDCDIDIANNNLTIYKGTQEKINNTDIKTKLTEFNQVNIK